MDPKFEEIEEVLIEIFLDLYNKFPLSTILDMDVTDDQVHGNQEGAFFNSYYPTFRTSFCSTKRYMNDHYYFESTN